MNLRVYVLVTATIAPATATIVLAIATTHVPVTATIVMNNLKLKLSICNEFRKNKATSTSGAYIH